LSRRLIVHICIPIRASRETKRKKKGRGGLRAFPYRASATRGKKQRVYKSRDAMRLRICAEKRRDGQSIFPAADQFSTRTENTDLKGRVGRGEDLLSLLSKLQKKEISPSKSFKPFIVRAHPRKKREKRGKKIDLHAPGNSEGDLSASPLMTAQMRYAPSPPRGRKGEKERRAP